MVDTAEFPAESTKRWVDEGYMPLELPNDEAQSAFRAGQYAMGYHVEKPGNDVESQNAYGFEFLLKNLTVPLTGYYRYDERNLRHLQESG